MLRDLPSAISLVEVSPRDGFQNESTIIPTDKKIAYINKLSQVGFRDIEVGSFVRPEWIPQLADTKEVLHGIRRQEGVRYWVLVPNRKGFENARSESVDCIAVFMSSSETHNRKNVNRTIQQSLEELGGIIEEARAHQILVRAYLSTAFGCPDEGFVDPAKVVAIAEQLMAHGANYLSIGDTIGVGNPSQVRELVDRLSKSVDLNQIALHFHDTQGAALANVYAGILAGITTFDASTGGIGGCPYAPGAAGNLAMDDLVNMLHGMGISCGVNPQDVTECSLYLRTLLDRELPSRYHSYFLGQRERIEQKAITNQQERN